MVPSSRIMVYVLYYAIIILNYAHVFAYGTISRVSSRVWDYGVMNVNIFQKANQRQVKMSGTSLLCEHLIDHLCDHHFSMNDDFKTSYCL